MDAYAKSDIPDHFGFRDNDLVLDVLIVSRDRAKIGTTYEYAEKFLPEANPGDGSESVFFLKKIQIGKQRILCSNTKGLRRD